LYLVYVIYMYWITEAGESTLIFLTNILATPLYFFFEFSFISGEIFLKVLRIVATILYYFHAVGFSNILLTVPLFRPITFMRWVFRIFY